MKRFFITLILSLTAALAFAQSIDVSGTVSDAYDGAPLAGVVVYVQGTGNNVITSFEGTYTIRANKGDILVYSFLGKQEVTVTVGNSSVIDVKLKDDTNTLEETVVIGYGTMKKRDLTGSVAQVRGDDLMQGNAALSFNGALQGKVAGVQVRQNDGAPGGGITILIRGANSFGTSTTPLYIVDGLPYGGGSAAPSTGVSGTGSGSNPLANINPNDIESIEVLKDASSTAIYGSRGANGVVIITTKRGSEGKSNITFSSTLSTSRIVRKMDVLDPVTYAEYINEQYYNYSPTAQQPYRGEWYYQFDTSDNMITSSGKYSPAPQDFLKPGVYEDEYGNKDTVGSTDWQDAIFQNGFTKEVNISVDGGNSQGGYLMSFNYSDQQGSIVGSGYTRFGVRTNIWRKINKWIEAGMNTNFANSVTNFVNSSTSGGDGVIYSALVFPPTYDASINTQSENELNWLAANPYVYVREAFDEFRANNFYLSSYLEITPIKGLKLRENIGFSYSGNDRNMYYNRLTRQGYAPTNGSAGQGTSWSQGFTSETLLTYHLEVGEHHTIDALLGTTFGQSGWKGNQMSGYNFPSDDTLMWDMSAAGSVRPLSSYRGQNQMQSNLARLNYSLMGKYLFTVSYRMDGSSVFVEGNKYAHFWSGAFAWRISDEKWMENLKAVNDMKLRVSYGETGNQGISTYATLPAMSVASYPLNGTLVAGYAEQTWKGPVNKNLRWETTEQFDTGIDVSLFKDRISFTADYYHKFTRDLLQQVNIESNSGYTVMFDNIGNVTNNGFEFTLKAIPFAGKFGWSIEGNISTNRNCIGGLPGDQYASSFVNGIKNVFLLRNGCQIGTIYGYVEDGFYDSRAEVRADPQFKTLNDSEADRMIGEIKYKDISGPDGVPDGAITEADKVIVGDTNPVFTYGLTNTFNWKNFTLSVFLQGTYGNDILNANTIVNDTSSPMTGIMNITRQQYDGRWTPDNYENATWPRAIAAGYTRVWRFSDRYIEDGSYLRVKNVSLGYTLFPKWQYINSLNVYFSVSNLFTFTKYSWFDPDVNAFSTDVTRQGVDLFSYPSSRTWSIGVKLSM